MSGFQFALLIGNLYIAVLLRDDKRACTLLGCMWGLLAIAQKIFQ